MITAESSDDGIVAIAHVNGFAITFSFETGCRASQRAIGCKFNFAMVANDDIVAVRHSHIIPAAAANDHIVTGSHNDGVVDGLVVTVRCIGGDDCPNLATRIHRDKVGCDGNAAAVASDGRSITNDQIVADAGCDGIAAKATQNDIAAITGGNRVNSVARACDRCNCVITNSAFIAKDDVVASLAPDDICSLTADQDVRITDSVVKSAGRTNTLNIPRIRQVTADGVVARAAVNQVVAQSAVQSITGRAAHQTIVAQTSIQCHGLISSGCVDAVVAVLPADRQRTVNADSVRRDRDHIVAHARVQNQIGIFKDRVDDVLIAARTA